MAPRSPGILVVDDEPSSRAVLGEILAGEGLPFETAGDPERALELAARASIGVVLLDVGVGADAHESLFERLRALRPSLRIIAVGGPEDEARVLAALRGGACDYLAAPIHDEELVLAARRALESYGVSSGFTQLRGRLDRLAARLEEIAARVAGRRGEDRLAMLRDALVDAASEVLEASKTSLMLQDPDGLVLRVVACAGRAMKPDELDAVEVGSGVAGAAFALGRGFVVVDASADPRVPGVAAPGRYATASFAVAPISTGGRPVGVLCATDRVAGDAFGDEDLLLLRILGVQAGELLAGVWPAPLSLAGEAELDGANATGDTTIVVGGGEDDAADAAHARDPDAELAREICQAVTDEVESERVLRGALRPVAARLPAAPVAIFLVDPSEDVLRRESECDGGFSSDRETLARGRGLTGSVVQLGHVVATSDPAADPRFDAEVDTPANGAVRPLLCVPLRLRGKLVGVCRAFLEPGVEPSARTAEVLSAALSAAVRNALLYRSLVEAIEDVADARRAARG